MLVLLHVADSQLLLATSASVTLKKGQVHHDMSRQQRRGRGPNASVDSP